ncbi:MAG: segregation/condensation protein A [Acidimicrobiia bacterium]|nr:segregation/condensation protein A [Acidimicrobiia bacterium]
MSGDSHQSIGGSYSVKTAVFEGPMGILLELVTRHQIEITAIDLSDLVSDYLKFLDEMRKLDLDVTSEFLLVAATLIQLKARALLPADADIDIDEELALMEERDRLLQRLLVCVTFRDVAAVIKHRLQETNRYVPRVSGLDQKIEAPPPEVVLPIDGVGLAEIASKVFTRGDDDLDLDHLDLHLPSVSVAIDELRVRIATELDTTFDELVEHCERPVELAAYFLALLELARWGIVGVSQPEWTGPIRVNHKEGVSAGHITSEWT